MLLNLLGELRQVELGAFARAQSGAIVQVVEEILVRVRAGGRVFG